MKPLLLTLALFLAICRAAAQEWTTMPRTDTAYFMAGLHSAGSYGSDSGLLRGACIAARFAAGTDSMFIFPTGIRDTGSNPKATQRTCLDTLAPSWLGCGMQRASDGAERYINRFGDTTVILTRAAVGQSWIMARSRSGLEFRAAVVAAGSRIIDGTQDSFKTIAIQAYSGTRAVPH